MGGLPSIEARAIPAEWLKAAALLHSLGVESAVEVLRRCSQDDLGKLAAAFLQLHGMAPGECNSWAEQAQREVSAGVGVGSDLLLFAREVLGAMLGSQAADQLLRGQSAARQSASLAWLPEESADLVADLLAEENPRIVAVVLAGLRPSLAARTLALLPPELRGESLLRLASDHQPTAEAIACISECVVQHVAAVRSAQQAALAGQSVQLDTGPKKVVELLRQCDHSAERAALEYLEQCAPEVAAQISQSIFSTLADLRWLDARSLQMVLRQVDIRELAKALRGASREITDLCFGNLSENAAQGLREEIETQGPLPRREVETAQRTILSLIRGLIEEGRIQVAQEEDLV